MATAIRTTVDGVAVIAEEQVESPLSTPERPIYFTRIKRFLLANETTVFGCSECGFTGATWHVVRGHLTTNHSDRKPRSETVPLGMTLGELLEQERRAAHLANQVERLLDERDEWKARAKEAERDLAAIRKALGVVTQ
jgi:hypothetical protein